jgi:molybdenum cofactor cytidylyltransferase
VTDIEEGRSSASVVGIVLAAGSSERMGRPKQLLPLAGTTMVDVVVQRALSSRLDRVIIVTGSNGSQVAAAVAPRHVEIVHNPLHFEGNMTSFRTGVEAAAGADVLLLLLGDMPGVGPAVINRMIEVWQSDAPWAAVASYGDGEGHPFLLSQSAVEHAMTLDGPKPLWRMLRLAPNGEVVHVEFDGPMPIDVDTEDDYEALLAGWSKIDRHPPVPS